MRACNFFVCGPKFTKFLTSNVGGVVVDHFVMSIYSGVICAQSWKLSEIASNFERVLTSQILLGHPFQNLYPHYYAGLASRRLVKFRKVTPTNPEVIGTHMLNFVL